MAMSVVIARMAARNAQARKEAPRGTAEAREKRLKTDTRRKRNEDRRQETINLKEEIKWPGVVS